MLFGIGARRWGRVRRQRSRRRRTRSRARGRGDFVGFISPSSVGIVRGLTVLNAVRSSHAALPKGHAKVDSLLYGYAVLAGRAARSEEWRLQPSERVGTCGAYPAHPSWPPCTASQVAWLTKEKHGNAETHVGQKR